jgi:hypothetical protein
MRPRKLAFDVNVEEGQVSDPRMLVEKETDRAYLTGFER